MFKDITEHKKAEVALKESEERYRSLFSSMDEAFALHEILYDSHGVPTDYRFLEINAAFERQTGLKASEIIGKTVCEVLPDLEPFWIETYGKVVVTGEPVRFENFSRSLKRYYEVYAYRPVQDRFAVIFTDITERKKTEEALKQSEIKFRTVADFTHDWEHWISTDGKLIYVSPSCERITGYKPEEFIKDPELITRIVHSDDKALIESHYKSIDSKALPDVDYRIITKSGEVRWIAHSCQPVFDGKGKWLGRRGSNRDITERKKAEGALLESEEKYKQLVDRLPEMIFEINNNGQVAFANSRAIEIIGYSKEELEKNFDANRFVASEDVERSRENMKKMFADGMRQSNEYVWVRKDGTRFPVLLTSAPIVKDNKVMGARGVGVDLTQLKLTEKALQKQAALIDLSPDAIIVIDFSGTITFWSKGAEKLYGWTSEEAIDRNAHKLLQTKFPQPLEEINSQLETKKNWHGELLHKAKDGHEVFVESRWLTADDDMSSILESNTDVTEQRKLEKQLQDSERMAAIGQTAGMVGHDIRNPLQAIVSELFLARQAMAEAKDKDTREALESINLIQEQVDYISKIVSDLQDYARQLNPEYKIVDLSDLIVSVFDTITLPDSIMLKVDVKGPLKFKTDPTFVKRAITNLVNNAIQAMPDGGELGLTAYKMENGVVISVSDTGKGIPEDVKA